MDSPCTVLASDVSIAFIFSSISALVQYVRSFVPELERFQGTRKPCHRPNSHLQFSLSCQSRCLEAQVKDMISPTLVLQSIEGQQGRHCAPTEDISSSRSIFESIPSFARSPDIDKR